MGKEKVTLRKIPIETLIATLVEIYDKGADYVDIVGIPDDTQDEIGIIVKEEYYHTNPEDGELDEDDLKNLL